LETLKEIHLPHKKVDFDALIKEKSTETKETLETEEDDSENSEDESDEGLKIH
jgi:hypothetical protein